MSKNPNFFVLKEYFENYFFALNNYRLCVSKDEEKKSAIWIVEMAKHRSAIEDYCGGVNE